jgi:RNase P/RNase MRP subunit p30
MAWDMFVRCREAADTAKSLGLEGIGVLVPFKERHELKEIRAGGIGISTGVIVSGSAGKVSKDARSVRRQAELVAVEGGDPEVNRAALSTPEVDMLLHPWKGRQDSGLDHIMVKIAAKNCVSVVFDFHSLLVSSRMTRVQLMNSMLEAAKLVRKLRAPFIIASGAVEPYDLRGASDLMSFGRSLGFRDPEIKKAMSDRIVKENRKRLSEKWIMPGVELE